MTNHDAPNPFPLITRLAIVNRGAAAMRLINAAREYAEERQRTLRIVVFHTRADQGAIFVREADEGVLIERDPDGDPDRDLAGIEQALIRAGIDAAWVGGGPLAQDPAFAELCDLLGIVAIGLGAATLRRIADRSLLAEAAREVGLALSPLSLVDQGYARHLDVLVAGDQAGGVRALGVHDGTLQRRSEKVLVETADEALTGVSDQRLRSVAEHLASRCGIDGAATIAFVRETEGSDISLLRISGGFPLGHGIAEVTSGIDLAKLQLALAERFPLEVAPPTNGHAIAVRLNAEDAELGFAPAPGQVVLLQVPTGPGLRIDPAVTEGDSVRPGEDPTIAEVIAWGRDREEARVRLRRALTQLPIVLAGGTTNKGFLLDLLDRDEVRSGSYDTAWLDRLAATGGTVGHQHGEVAVLMAAVDAYDEVQRIDRDLLFATARRGRPEVSSAVGRSFELCLRRNDYAVAVRRTGRRRYRVSVDGAEVGLIVTRLARFQSRVEVAGKTFRVVSAIQGGDHVIEVDGIPHRLLRRDGGLVRAPSPGVVVAVAVHEGDLVAADDTLVVIESMKMESHVLAPFDGLVRHVHTGTNVQVDSGAPLVTLDPRNREESGPTEPRQVLQATGAEIDETVEGRFVANLDTLIRLFMGYDVAAAAATKVAADQAAIAADVFAGSPQLLVGELRLLSVFADLRALFRSQRDLAESDLMVRSPQEYLHAFLRSPGPDTPGLPTKFLGQLRRALGHYGVSDLQSSEALEEALYWIMRSRQRIDVQVPVVVAMLSRWLERAIPVPTAELRDALDRLVAATQRDHPVVADLAREVRYELIDRPVIDTVRHEALTVAFAHVDAMIIGSGDRVAGIDAVVGCMEPLEAALLGRAEHGDRRTAGVVLELITRRHHRWGSYSDFNVVGDPSAPPVLVVEHDGPSHGPICIVTTCAPYSSIQTALASSTQVARSLESQVPVHIEAYTWLDGADLTDDDFARQVEVALSQLALSGVAQSGVNVDQSVQQVVVALAASTERATGPEQGVRHVTFRSSPQGFTEDRFLRGLHPMMAERLRLWRLANFSLQRLPASPAIHLFRGVAHENVADERLFAIAEVRDLTAVRDDEGRVIALPELERTLLASMEGIRRYQAPRALDQRLWWNRVMLVLWPPMSLELGELAAIGASLAPTALGLGLEEVDILCRRPDPISGELHERMIRFATTTGADFVVHETDPALDALETLDEYARKVVQSRRRGTIYPYELIRSLVAPFAGGRNEITGGTFVEHDLDEPTHDEPDRLVPVDRAAGGNTASIVCGIVTNTTVLYPEGMRRVALFGDPTRALGALAEPECRRIMRAIDLADELRIPVEWFALSAGAKIAMDSGTENMDWIAAVLRRIIEFTQDGGEINVVVTGINVGAQPYWNAEATMLMHTKGILVMTPDSAMVLTGKQALDFSGGISADDNHGIGGYERVMGANGQAQFWAPDVAAACGVLLSHYLHSYVTPGERFPRRADTIDPFDRDVRLSPHTLAGSDLASVGDIFSERANPDRKKPFDMRSVMRAVLDADHPTMERWADLADADTAIVWDAHLGGFPVCALGIEAHALTRHGSLPADGPDLWTSGTLFPMSSKKVARAINATSGTRPLVVLANLSGFDGSPESMRRVQLEFGAEIGRAVVNFKGPIVFCVVSRFHGGAFVVFSRLLNTELETLAVEGAHASVIGGSPAAAVVFAGEVRKRTLADPRVVDLQARIAASDGAERARLGSELAATMIVVHSDQLGAVAAEFDAVHSVERAQQVGSVNTIIPAEGLRPLLIDAVQRGVDRELAKFDATR